MNLVIQIRTTGIEFCTSVKEFSIYIIQIKMPVESIQISNLRGKRIFEHSNSHVGNRIRNYVHSNSHMHVTYVYSN